MGRSLVVRSTRASIRIDASGGLTPRFTLFGDRASSTRRRPRSAARLAKSDRLRLKIEFGVRPTTIANRGIGSANDRSRRDGEEGKTRAAATSARGQAWPERHGINRCCRRRVFPRRASCLPSRYVGLRGQVHRRGLRIPRPVQIRGSDIRASVLPSVSSKSASQTSRSASVAILCGSVRNVTPRDFSTSCICRMSSTAKYTTDPG